MHTSGLLFDIQGFSVHDGSGCRTLVFLSGCPLRCLWCANPEGWLPRPRLMFRAQHCVHRFYSCVAACLAGAARKATPESNEPHDTAVLNRPAFDTAACDRCDTMPCVTACRHEALQIAGRAYTVDELMRVLARDQSYWGAKGGVTFSGGEPLLQGEFLLAVLRECRARYMHTAVETSAHADSALLAEILRYTDWLFIDIKHLDPVAHRAETGGGNDLILRNVERVAASDWKGRLIIRIPIVPGFNDSDGNLRATAEFAAGLGLKEINLLPFHRLGNSKYEQLGLTYKYANAVRRP